jgi:uncharacterized membrane protein YdjX (TVP38/TMEM64 family)
VFGYLVFAVAYALACVLFIPASILTLAAGAVYGVAVGSAVVLVGATAGATASFLLARTILRERVAAWVQGKPKLDALDRAIGKEGAKIVLLVRLAPVFPFTYMNYVFGLTRIATVPYVVATVIGMLPATISFVFLGSAAASAATAEVSRTRTIIQVAGAILAVVATGFVSRVAARAIRKAGEEEPQ